jgi:hypothetical protein
MEEEANKRKWENVPINIPKSFQVNPDGARLVITNQKKNWKIHKLSIKLRKLIEGNRPLLVSVLENNDIWISVSKGGSFFPRRSLDVGLSGIFSISHWNDEEAWINIMDNHSVLEKVPVKKDITYKLILRFVCFVDGRWMDENNRSYALRYVNHKIEIRELE